MRSSVPGRGAWSATPSAWCAGRREGPEATLTEVVGKHAGSADASVYEVDVPVLVERLRGLVPAQLTAVIDLAERMEAAVRRGDVDGRERVRREFGIAG